MTDAPFTRGGIPTSVFGSIVLAAAERRGTGSPRWSARALARSAAVCSPGPPDDHVRRARPAAGQVDGDRHLHGGTVRTRSDASCRVIHSGRCSRCENPGGSGSLGLDVSGSERWKEEGAVDAVRTLEDEVRELIRRSGLDPARDEPRCAGWSATRSRTTTSGRCTAGCRCSPTLTPPPSGVGHGRRLRSAAAVLRRPVRRGDLDQRAQPGLHRPPRRGRADDDPPDRTTRCATSSSGCSSPRADGSTCPRPSSTLFSRRVPAARRHPRHHP